MNRMKKTNRKPRPFAVTVEMSFIATSQKAAEKLAEKQMRYSCIGDHPLDMPTWICYRVVGVKQLFK